MINVSATKSPVRIQYINNITDLAGGHLCSASTMAKYTLTLLFILGAIGLALSSPVEDFGKGPLHDDLKEFLELLPHDEINRLIVQYGMYDYQFQLVLRILAYNSVELLQQIESIPELRDIMDYLYKNGVEIYDIVNTINDIIGVDRLTPSRLKLPHKEKITGGLIGFVKDIMKLVPVNKIIKLYFVKMRTSPAFADFIRYVRSLPIKHIIQKIINCPVVQVVLRKIKEAGVHLQELVKLLRTIFDFVINHFHSYNLQRESVDVPETLQMANVRDTPFY